MHSSDSYLHRHLRSPTQGSQRTDRPMSDSAAQGTPPGPQPGGPAGDLELALRRIRAFAVAHEAHALAGACSVGIRLRGPWASVADSLASVVATCGELKRELGVIADEWRLGDALAIVSGHMGHASARAREQQVIFW